MSSSQNTKTATYSHVVAENAPIGVQLWPTRAPKFAPNFTLAAVEINEAGNVVWTYQNGNQRVFRQGEQVVVQVA